MIDDGVQQLYSWTASLVRHALHGMQACKLGHWRRRNNHVRVVTFLGSFCMLDCFQSGIDPIWRRVTNVGGLIFKPAGCFLHSSL